MFEYDVKGNAWEMLSLARAGRYILANREDENVQRAVGSMFFDDLESIVQKIENDIRNKTYFKV